MANTILDIAVANGMKQGAKVDYITEGSPIIASAPFFQSTHGLSTVYEEIKSITAGGFVDIDGVLTATDVTSDLKKKDLSILAGELVVGQDRASQMGGAASYAASKMPYIMKRTTQNAESDLIYNVLTSYAVANGNVIDIGGTGSTNYSILCVRWEEGQCSGVYDANKFDANMLYVIEQLYNGALGKFTVGANDINGYGWQFKAYLGFLLANPRNVSVMVNIDPANSKLPTGIQMDELLVKARVGDGGNPYLYMHPSCRSKALNQFKGDALQVMNADAGINRLVSVYNDVPVVTSYNFLDGSEAKVTV